jgi:hypothetical protein
LCILLLIFLPFLTYAQESEVRASSATDSKVKVHTGKRIRATTPPKKFRPRFREKNKKAVNVSEKPVKVQTNPKRKQKKRNKFRQNGRD